MRTDYPRCLFGDDVAKKKKGMTKAQAAAARKEQTESSMLRAKAKERSQINKKTVQVAQQKASKSRGTAMIVPIITVLVIIVLSLVFTIGPGMIMGGQA